MIIEKNIIVKIGRRNLSLVRIHYPNAKDRDILEIPQKLCLEIARCNVLECICDQCGNYYTQSATRMIEMPQREYFCGYCMHSLGMEKMKKTWRTERKRKEQSEKLFEFYATEEGKQSRKSAGERHSEYLKSRTDLHETFTSNLPRMYGEDHPNFNPNKTEFQQYWREVKTITEKVYREHKDIINPNGHQRTLSGVENGYQLDHIISVKRGFNEGISPEIIGGVDNLQILPWEENRKKWHR